MCVNVKRCLYRAVYVKLDAAGRARVLFATDQGHVSRKSRKTFLGPKSNLKNYDPLVLKSLSVNMFSLSEKTRILQSFVT